MIKYIVQILFLFLPVCVLAQHHHLNSKRVDLGVTQNFPMKNGKVWYTDLQSFSGCRMGSGVVIESNNDSVFSSCGGKVSAIFDLGDYRCLVVKVDTSTFYSIVQLSFVVVQSGQFITKGSFIGKSKQDEEKRLYSIMYLVLDKKGRYFSEQEIWKLLKQSDQSEHDKEKIAYQANQINPINHGSDKDE